VQSKLFSAECQARFAALSGDHNPMHMDAVAARRTSAGAPVVHGMHTLLWLIDELIGQRPDLLRARTLKARFAKMVYVGERAEAELLQAGATALRARVMVDGVEVVSLALGFSAPESGTQAPTWPETLARPDAAALPPPLTAINLLLEQIEGRAGRLQFASSPAAAAEKFPRAAAYLGPQRVAAMASMSCLVGMVVPGLHSIFGSLDLAIENAAAAAVPAEDALAYAVASVDLRFRLVRIVVQGAGFTGILGCVSRPPPVSQPSVTSLAAAVAREEFRGAMALVVGGSRGLGELTAKLVAAGGGRVALTYSQGKADAEAVAQEIRTWGGHCETVRYDIREAAAAQLAALREAPTHLYYFPTPTIYRRKAGMFDQGRLAEFSAYYLAGFHDLVQACLQRRPAGLEVFYPSTVYVDSRPAELTEYAMAKAAGEVLCADMEEQLRGLRVLVRRLPRMPTDQTGSLLPGENADPVAIMLPIVRLMHRPP
jgi:hypothetical protein